MQLFTKPKITCPFCFNSFQPQEMVFRYEWYNCGGRAVDALYAKEQGKPEVLMGHVIVPPKAPRRLGLATDVLRVAECDICHKESRAHLCPKCHYRFPPGVGLNDQRMIAIIGGRTTGKTNYIATLIKRMEDIGTNFKLNVLKADDDTITRWERDFYTPSFYATRL